MGIKRVGLTILALLLFFPLMGAPSLRVGYLPTIAANIESPIGEQLFAFATNALSQIACEESFREKIEERLNRQEYLKYLEEAHKQIAKGDGQTPQGEYEPLVVEFEETIAGEWIYLKLPFELIKGVEGGEAILIDYILSSNALDTLLIFKIERLDRFYRLRLILLDELLYDAIVEPQELSTLTGDLFITLLNRLVDPKIALLGVEGLSSTISLTIDGEKRDSYDRFIPLVEGDYMVRGVAPGYLPFEKKVTLEAGSINPFTLTLEAIDPTPLLLTSITGSPTVQISDGLVASLPLVWPNQRPPYTLYATQEGRLPLVKQVGTAVGEIEINLNPLWMEQGVIIRSSQNKFYQALGRSLILAGGTILVDTLSRTFSQQPLWQPLVWATLGAFALSTFDASYQLFAYYQKTKYSSQ
jgi:hypothetical protein